MSAAVDQEALRAARWITDPSCGMGLPGPDESLWLLVIEDRVVAWQAGRRGESRAWIGMTWRPGYEARYGDSHVARLARALRPVIRQAGRLRARVAAETTQP